MKETFSNSTNPLASITVKQILIAFAALVVVNLIAGYGVVWLGADIKGIYSILNKPYFAPPTWVFGIVWGFNCLMVTYGILLTLNSPKVSPFANIRAKLIACYGLLILNYCVFQYLSFGSKILFGQLLPIMFFLPTLSMLILTIVGLRFAYQLDIIEMSLKSKVLSGK
jgi:tryptophan-rich sensory protein